MISTFCCFLAVTLYLEMLATGYRIVMKTATVDQQFINLCV